MPDMNALADALVAAKEEVEKAKATLKGAEDAFAAAEKALAEEMASADEAQIKASGRYVTRKTKRSWAVPSANKETLYGVLKAHEPAIVKETVHAGSLNKLANEMEANAAAPAWWADAKALLEQKESTEISVTKSKPKNS